MLPHYLQWKPPLMSEGDELRDCQTTLVPLETDGVSKTEEMV